MTNEHRKADAILVKKKTNPVINEVFPVFFKYFRMNEIQMTITYFHDKNSFLNSKELKVKLTPFISHYKFLPFKKMFDNYEGHCKKVFISQIPNILKQKFLKAKQKVDEVTNNGVTNSLIQGVSRVKDLSIVQGILPKKKKKTKKKTSTDGNLDELGSGRKSNNIEGESESDEESGSKSSEDEQSKLESKKANE